MGLIFCTGLHCFKSVIVCNSMARATDIITRYVECNKYINETGVRVYPCP